MKLSKYFLPPAIVLSCLSLYQHWQLKHSGGLARGFCDNTSIVGCDSVSVSPWAEPIAGYSISTFALGILLLMLICECLPKIRQQILPMYLICAAGSLFYLSIMFFTMDQYCILCLLIHACILTATLFKFFEYPRIFSRGWVWMTAILTPILFSVALTHWGLPQLIQWKHWKTLSLYGVDFKYVPPPIMPVGAPIVSLGKSGGKEFQMIVAADFTCLHCRDHFFELSRALKASGYHATIALLLDPMELECNPVGELNHSGACNAARVGLCKMQQGQFESYFKKIYLTPGLAGVTAEILWKLESTTQEEQNQLKTCVESAATEKQLQEHIQTTFKENISGTPLTWIDGYKFIGTLNWSEWSEIFRRISSKQQEVTR